MIQSCSIPYERNGHRITNSFYPCVWIVSKAALEERKANWHEISGVCAGYAVVDHADWHELYTEVALREKGACGVYQVCVTSPDDELGHTGTISRLTNGQLELQG